jgi:dTDP-4-amino-4,6-dideoxygalactose transaminase
MQAVQTKLNIPLLSIEAQTRSIRAEIDEAIGRVIDHGKFILGPEVTELEQSVATYCSTKHAVACASGSDAILLALMALNIGPGDRVITTTYSFFATAGSIARLGAVPVFLDIEPESYNLSPDKLYSYLKSCRAEERGQIKAVMPVHLFGQCANMSSILELCAELGIPVVEDAAQAIGSEYQGRRSGSLGLCGCFSFFPSKNLGCFGDGGLVTTNDDSLAERLRVLRVHGSKPKYFHKVIGLNSRLDTLQAAILNVKLRYLDQWTEGRIRNADRYRRALSDAGCDWLGLPEVVIEGRHVYNQFVVRTSARNRFMDHLKQNGIGCEVYYPVPLHMQECFEAYGYQPEDCPEANRAATETVALPIQAELGAESIEAISSVIASFRP